MATEVSNAKWNVVAGSRIPSFQALVSQSRASIYMLELTFKDNYATGGLEVDLKARGVKHVDFVLFGSSDTGYILSYDIANGKVLAYTGAGELANASNTLINKKATVLVIGR